MNPLRLLFPFIAFAGILFPFSGPVDNATLRRHAEEGDAAAANLLGFRYFLGQGIDRNVDSALLWLNRSADAGWPEALSNLGILYSTGALGEDRDSLAVGYLERAAARGVPEAASVLADHLLSGRAVAADTLRAEHLLAQAARSGLPDALIRLRDLIPPGNPTQLADTSALAALGDAAAFGRVLPYDRALSLTYYLRAALSGHSRSRKIIAEELEFFPDALSLPPLVDILKAYPDSLPDFHSWGRP